MIPQVRPWVAEGHDGIEYVCWGPTAALARMNLNAYGLLRVTRPFRAPRYDRLPVPQCLVMPRKLANTLLAHYDPK